MDDPDCPVRGKDSYKYNRTYDNPTIAEDMLNVICEYNSYY